MAYDFLEMDVFFDGISCDHGSGWSRLEFRMERWLKGGLGGARAARAPGYPRSVPARFRALIGILNF